MNQIDLKEYQECQKNTTADLGSLNGNVAHMALGVSGEYFKEVVPLAQRIMRYVLAVHDEQSENEVYEGITETVEEAVLEIGDVCWYTVGLANLFNLEAKEQLYIIGDVSEGVPIHQSIGCLCEVAKKCYAYDKPVDTEELNCHINNVLYHLKTFLSEFTNVSIEHVYYRNIEKLKQRYPSGTFSKEDAVEKRDESN